MAEVMRSAIFAAKEETTADTFIAADAASFIPMRDGASMKSGVELLTSDELYNSIGESKQFVSKESPSGVFPKYAKHSGTEGTEPEYGIFIESSMGNKTVQSTERTASSSSTAGTRAAAAIVKVADGTQWEVGQALLIKDQAAGVKYTIRNIASISSNDLTLAYNLESAPASGTNLGKCVHYYAASTGHPSFTAHMWQAQADSAVYQAISGCRTTGMAWKFPANGFAEVSFDYSGSKSYLNPITITASNKYLDFNDGTLGVAIMEEKTYQSPHQLIEEIITKLNQAATTLTFTGYYDDETGKFTISAGGTFTMLFASGANTANDIGSAIGFTVDQTAAATYTSATAIDFDTLVTPTYQDVDNIVVKDAELKIGDWFRDDCHKFTDCSFTVSTPVADINNGCAENGLDSKIVTKRSATFSATILLKQYEVLYFDKMINNTTTKLAFTVGSKTGGNWDAGKCMNIFFQNCTISGSTIEDNGGVVVYKIEAKAHVTSTAEDVHINFV